MRVYRHTLVHGDCNHELIWSLVGLGSALLVLLYVWVIGVPSVVCPFHYWTGFPCFSCGFTRSVLSFLRGDFCGSFRSNPLMFLIIVLWSLYIPYGLCAQVLPRFVPRIRVEFNSFDMRVVRVLILAFVVIVWGWLIYDGR